MKCIPLSLSQKKSNCIHVIHICNVYIYIYIYATSCWFTPIFPPKKTSSPFPSEIPGAFPYRIMKEMMAARGELDGYSPPKSSKPQRYTAQVKWTENTGDTYRQECLGNGIWEMTSLMTVYYITFWFVSFSPKLTANFAETGPSLPHAFQNKKVLVVFGDMKR